MAFLVVLSVEADSEAEAARLVEEALQPALEMNEDLEIAVLEVKPA